MRELDKELYSLKHELINLQLDLEKLQKEKSKVKHSCPDKINSDHSIII